MYFYIIEKDDSFTVIEADEKLFLTYEKQGFRYIDKVAAKDKKSALKCLNKQNLIPKLSVSLLLIFIVISVIVTIIKM